MNNVQAALIESLVKGRVFEHVTRKGITSMLAVDMHNCGDVVRMTQNQTARLMLVPHATC